MNLAPLEDRVIVEPKLAESVTPGGIALPDAAKELPQRGLVLAVGPGHLLENGTRHPIAVNVGDEVLFAKFAGADIEVDGAKYRLLREGEILAKFEGE